MTKLIQLYRNTRDTLSLTGFLCAFLLVPRATDAQTIVDNIQSSHDGYFYSFWNDGASGSASMTLGPGGNYSTTWINIGNFTAGKGWAKGSADRAICFSGTFDGGSNGYFAVYGWTKDPLIEYYIVESWGSWRPPGATSKGTFTSDDGTYEIYETTRTEQPSIVGTATFQQYWSVRTSKRLSGTVTFANHVAAWESKGMYLGTTWDYQIMLSEGYQSTGSSDVTVSECAACATPEPVTTRFFDYAVGEEAARLTATGTSLKWYTDNITTIPLAEAPTPSTATEGTTRYYVSQTLNGCEGARAEITVRVSNRYEIYKAATPVNIDGIPEAVWENASIIPARMTKLIVGEVANNADLSGEFKALWDDAYLYVLADITDDVKINDSRNVYDDDGIEIYVDINNDKATTYGDKEVQYSFGWNDGTAVGTIPAARSSDGIIYKIADRPDGYVVEVRIPWTNVQGTPAIGKLLGIEFMVNDDDDGEDRDGKLSWHADTDEAWRNPSLYGTAILRGLLPCATPEPVASPVVYCQGDAPESLTATGLALKWYMAATEGTALASAPVPETDLTGTTNYYVSQTIAGCESQRTMVSVIVNPRPEAIISVDGHTTIADGEVVSLDAAQEAGLTYTWYNGDTEVGSGPSYTASTAGNYTVEVTNESGCSSISSPVAIIVDMATGIQAFGHATSDKVYPVPAREEVMVETESDLTGAIFRITNAMGEEVTLPVRIQGNKARLNVLGLAKGTYLLMIRQSSDLLLTKKIIIAD